MNNRKKFIAVIGSGMAGIALGTRLTDAKTHSVTVTDNTLKSDLSKYTIQFKDMEAYKVPHYNNPYLDSAFTNPRKKKSRNVTKKKKRK